MTDAVKDSSWAELKVADLEEQLAAQRAVYTDRAQRAKESATLRRTLHLQITADTNAKLQADVQNQSTQSWCVLAI